eukprot:TRINITY_DN19911_c1_g2_i1.p1 TRINITY_DN19911_c1_g2~~TRINITY_DN19911_c1_g2_i1.p1  ORF type:complete len:646 (+),score=61.01 TRINITY_DN19911_c1_g2_i1:85-2022(+)
MMTSNSRFLLTIVIQLSLSLQPSQAWQEAEPAYDVIVVGGGLTGSIVAAKLAEKLSDKKILLLEGGQASHQSLGGTEPPSYYDYGKKQFTPWPGSWEGLTRYDVPSVYSTMHCWSAGCQPASWPDLPAYQCKILGGCGVMNGALGQIPLPGNFASWPIGWQFEDMEPYLDSARELFYYTQTPSADGLHYLNDTGADLVRTAFLNVGFSDGDPIQAKNGIMGVPYVSSKHGLRVSTASELLPAALQLDNFEMRLDAHVVEIVHDDGLASAVKLETGEILKLRPAGRIILTAGVWNTARMLLQNELGNDQVGKGVSDHTHHSSRWEKTAPSSWNTLNAFSLKPPSSESIGMYLGQNNSGNACGNEKPDYEQYFDKNAFQPYGATDIDDDQRAPSGLTPQQCEERCSADASCMCVTQERSTGKCWKRGSCVPSEWVSQHNAGYNVYMKRKAAPSPSEAFAGVGPLAQYGPTFVVYMKAPSTNTSGEEEDFDVELWVSPATPSGSESSDPPLDIAIVLMRPECSSLDIELSQENSVLRSNDQVHEDCKRDSDTIKSVEAFVQNAMNTVGYSGEFNSGDDMNHWAGSCKLGSCTDPATLTVLGTQNVLAADASILPTQVWGHPSLTLQALALKAADTIASNIASESYIIP